jgi:hypothetical protein
MKPKLITADNSYLKFEGTSDQAFDFIDAMAQLDASKNMSDLVFNIEVALQREGFLDGDFNRVDDTLSYPFEDGDTFYTIENGLVIESVWDEQAEEMHDDNPDCVYYNCHVDAVNAHKAQLLEFLSNNLRADHFKDQCNLYQSAINYITSTDSTLCSNCGHDLGYGYMDCGAGIAGDCPECGHNNRQLH